MFWTKPLALLAALAASGNAAPLNLLGGDFEDQANITTLEQRTLVARAGSVSVVFRKDDRSPEMIKSSGGFKPWATTIGTTADYSLFAHCSAHLQTKKDSGYVSTSSSEDFVTSWKPVPGSVAYVYKIAAYETLVDTKATLKQHNPHDEEKEFANIGTVPWEQIISYYKFVYPDKHEVVKNPQYNAAKYDGHRDSGAMYELAGFPDTHVGWRQAPWKQFAAGCDSGTGKKGTKSKLRRDIDATESIVEDNVSRELAVEDMPAAPLEARRSRGGRSRSSRKRPSAGSRKKRPAKKTSSKKKKTSGKKKTTSKKKPTTKKPASKCTAAMKKAGKCKATKKPATKCTAAQKKANGGKCPATKKTNKCTAAQKKANGGKCPAKCTAAMKKAGKCPNQNQSCKLGPKRKNAVVYKEYLKIMKTGRTPKPKATKGGKKGGKTRA